MEEKGRWHREEMRTRQERKGTETQDEGLGMEKGKGGGQHNKQRILGGETGRHRKKKVITVGLCSNPLMEKQSWGGDWKRSGEDREDRGQGSMYSPSACLIG